MAHLHQATISPTKDELLGAWLPGRPWFPGGGIEKVGAYRFDDPAGEVGIEGFVLRTAEGRFVHALLTYRGEPLAGAEEHLVATMEHSVLGTRWVYDGCADPVAVAAVATAVATGGRQAEEFVEGVGPRRPSVTVVGSGTAGTRIGEVGVVHVVGADAPEGAETLTGTWEGGSGVLATAPRL